MSRIGKAPVELPEGVEAKINGKEVTIKGPKGELNLTVHQDVDVKQQENTLVASPLVPNTKFGRAIWATTRALLANNVLGVTKGFEKVLELKGVGYRAQLQGKELVLALGYSHDVKFQVPEGINITVDKQTVVTISGIDKQLVGEVAANIRKWREPEPYKGKGIRYSDEYVIRKEGKKK